MSEDLHPTGQRTLLEKIFLSRNERRLRAGWRLAIHTVLLLVLIILASLVAIVALTLLQAPLTSPLDAVNLLLNEIVLFAAVTISTFLARRFIDRRSMLSLGLKPNMRAVYDTLAGIAISFFMMGSIFVGELAIGWTRFDGFAWQTQAAGAVAGSAAIWLVIFVFGGWAEELLSRGYHLQNLVDGLNPFWGVIISSAVFGLLHLANSGTSWISTLGIFLAGVFLAVPYLLTRQLWLSIGLHIGWNFFEGVVFGFPVSGLDTYSLIHHVVGGPVLWTGGAFGPEAGLILIPALLAGTLLVYVYTRPEIRSEVSGQ